MTICASKTERSNNAQPFTPLFQSGIDQCKKSQEVLLYKVTEKDTKSCDRENNRGQYLGRNSLEKFTLCT